jgi:hypothetical protein
MYLHVSSREMCHEISDGRNSINEHNLSQIEEQKSNNDSEIKTENNLSKIVSRDDVMNALSNSNISSLRPAGGRSSFFQNGPLLYKKDASSKELKQLDFYKYLEDKPDLMVHFPKFYGVIEMNSNDLDTIVDKTESNKIKKSKKYTQSNYLICMENLCYGFDTAPLILDLKMAIPKTVKKYHISRTSHEFSIHGMRIPNSDGTEMIFDHKKHRDLDYDDDDTLIKILGPFFPSDNLLEETIGRIRMIHTLFKKYIFDYECSILIIHDTNKLIVKVIDCSYSCTNSHNSEEKNIDGQNTISKRTEYLIQRLLMIQNRRKRSVQSPNLDNVFTER